MAASIVELCQGIADAINGAGSGTFSEPFTAVFEYAPQYTIPDTETLRVVVTDAGGTIERPARRLLQYADTARVVVMWRVADASGTGIDADLMERGLVLLEEITEFLFGLQIGNFKQSGSLVRGDGEKDKSHYYPGNLDQGLIFAADLRIGYQKQVQV